MEFKKIGTSLTNMRESDVIIIGGGPGGAKAARTLARGGKKVALVSSDLGGECLNWGCIPTKTYVWTAELFEKISGAAAAGIELGTIPKINWAQMKQRRSEVVSKLKKQLRFSVEKAGVTIIDGIGVLKDAHTVEVKTADGTTATLTAPHIILATGSQATLPPGITPDKKFITNHEILDLPEIPKTLLVMGGGAVGVEFASIFATLGTKVTIAEHAERLIPHEDPEVSAELERVFSRKGITILKNTLITAADTTAFEKVLVAVGRTPTTAGLGIESAGLTATKRGIETNEHMQTTVPNIFAIGDLAGKALLAYTAEQEGEIAARAILGLPHEPLRYDAVPNTIFSLPEIASVGLTEATLTARQISFITGKSSMSANAKALILGSRDGFAKILAEKNSHRILGIHIIGEKASELIAEAVHAITHEMTLEQFAQSLHGHPLLGEILKEACEASTVNQIGGMEG